MNKQPEVTARTRQKFIDAFWALSAEKRVTQITAGELSRRAGYNRSTFYEYFTDVPDLLTQVEDSLLETVEHDFKEAADQIILRKTPPGYETFRLAFHVLNAKMYALLGPNGDPAFFPRLCGRLLPMLTETLGLPADLPGLDYIISFTYSGVIGYLQHWHETGQALPEEEVLQLGFRLLSQGVVGVLSAYTQNLDLSRLHLPDSADRPPHPSAPKPSEA